jgi:tRNA-splicing ligase RtcB
MPMIGANPAFKEPDVTEQKGNSLIKSDDHPNTYIHHVGDGKFITVIANEQIAAGIEQEALRQSSTALCCPGVEDVVLTPDTHQGFGVAVGTVAKTNGTIFPSYVGVDIACGMRSVLTPLEEKDIKQMSDRQRFIDQVKRYVPVGPSSHETMRFDEDTTRSILQGKTRFDDTALIERSDLDSDMRPEGGMVTKAQYQLGTMGGGNHFCEIQVVEEVDDKIAPKWGIHVGQVVLMLHSGSRRVGMDVANRYKGELLRWFREQRIDLVNDDGVWCLTKHAPKTALDDAQEAFLRKYGEAYVEEMNMCSNFAVANRSLMQEQMIKALRDIYGVKPRDNKLLYDISHNIAAIEDGKIVIRKGATRAFPKGHPMLKGTAWYETGHPIILPGSMDSNSYIMVGTQDAVRTHFSINHGAGRTMSREKAKKTIDRRIAKKAMENIAHNHEDVVSIIDETAGGYKDISAITDSVVGAGIAKVVAKVRPLGVIKG